MSIQIFIAQNVTGDKKSFFMPLPKPQKCLKSGKFFLNGFTIVWWSEENKLLWNFQNQIHVIKTILLFLSTFMDKQALIFMFMPRITSNKVSISAENC